MANTSDEAASYICMLLAVLVVLAAACPTLVEAGGTSSTGHYLTWCNQRYGMGRGYSSLHQQGLNLAALPCHSALRI
ncbi:hypothetical protein COO60DRAFT_1653717 [Scenedesmus sp. NREL 46B-D3]|nr:hypothetical protein COO60DRAFT_1653717 [Scenedesmus sp. NREL 46B-D3]